MNPEHPWRKYHTNKYDYWWKPGTAVTYVDDYRHKTLADHIVHDHTDSLERWAQICDKWEFEHATGY